MPFPVTVELGVGTAGAWVDVSAYVYARDPVTITRGRADEASRVDASAARLTLNNRDGRFSPRNPTGAWYGTLGRNTPIRISVTSGSLRVRFVGEVSSWPTQWGDGGRDVWTSIEAAGIMRRLGQGVSPVDSAMRQRILMEGYGPTLSDAVVYWPAEDAEGSTSLASGVGGSPLRISGGTPTLATNGAFTTSAPLPVLNGATLTGSVPAYPTNTELHVRLLFAIPAMQTEGSVLLSVRTSGTLGRVDVTYYQASGGSLKLNSYDGDGNFLSLSSAALTGIDGKLWWLALNLTQVGANVEQLTELLQVGTSTKLSMFRTQNSTTVGFATRITINRGGTLDDVTVGHVMLTTNPYESLDGSWQMLAAYAGETAAYRITRLCEEQGIPITVHGDPSTSVLMGPQRVATFLDLLGECADADGGILCETRDTLGLTYCTRSYLYNQATALALTYSAVAELTPVDDDQSVRNDVTVSRIEGSSARAVLETGRLSVLPPPDGVGRYDDAPPALNVASDGQLADIAGWRLHVGTLDEARYPTLAVRLSDPAFTASAALTAAAFDLDIGEKVTVTGLPAWLPPGPIEVIAQGFTETLDTLAPAIAVNATPASLWNVFALGSATHGRLDSEDSTLAAGYTATATTFSVAVAAGSALWITTATHPAEFPFLAKVAGEEVTVTAITGTSSPQSWTVSRAANGAVKAQLAGAAVRIARPVSLAM